MESYFTGKRVLITSGTSGLGKALSAELTLRGARVSIVARGLSGSAADGVHLIQADISRKEDIYRISGQAIAHLGSIDILINGASYLGATPLRLLIDTDCEDFSKVWETNVLGPFRLIKAILPSMLLRKKGTILNISSDAAASAYSHWGSYGTSKAALAHLSLIWQEELRDHGVKIIALDPGDMDTSMHAAAVPNSDPATLLKPRDAALRLLQVLASEGAK